MNLCEKGVFLKTKLQGNEEENKSKKPVTGLAVRAYYFDEKLNYNKTISSTINRINPAAEI